MDATSLALGGTGTAGVVIGLIYFLLKKGARSKCVVAGQTIVVDVHETTKNEMSPKSNEVVISDAVRQHDKEVQSGV
jgi:hypothetical protein